MSRPRRADSPRDSSSDSCQEVDNEPIQKKFEGEHLIKTREELEDEQPNGRSRAQLIKDQQDEIGQYQFYFSYFSFTF